jgi:mRNA-degrading endonuclease RelE of RelBE toxin-antitoxin system
MQIIYSVPFRKAYKKLHANQRLAIDAAMQKIKNDPKIGQRKLGDLNGIYIHKFQMINQLCLLAYDFTDAGDIILEFLDFGPHENFYRDLKK